VCLFCRWAQIAFNPCCNPDRRWQTLNCAQLASIRARDPIEQWSPNGGICTPGGVQGDLLGRRKKTVELPFIVIFIYKKGRN